MGGSIKTPRQPDRVAELTARVEALAARLEALEAVPPPGENGNGQHNSPHSRRDLFKLAGAAAAGAAGSILLGAVPAAATSGQPVLLGNNSTNDAATTTDLFPTTLGTTPAPLLQATGQGVLSTTTVPATVSTTAPTSQSIPLIGAIGAGGSLPPVGHPAVNDYPGFAPIQGVGGKTTVTTLTGTKTYSEGVNGFGTGSTGIGITGESDIGYGVAGGSGGIDVAALGNGRVLQLSLPDGLLTTPGVGPPNYVANDFEQARDGNGVLWLSKPGGSWRRMNSVVPVAPFRIYDSRNVGQRPANSVTTITIAGVGSVPSDAIAVFGNLTAIGPAADGFLTMYPTGLDVPGVNSVNYSRGVSAWSNLVMVPLGSGQVSVYVSGNGPTNFLFDVSGYVT